MIAHRTARSGGRAAALLLLLLGGAGCATNPIPAARENFYRGRLDQAEAGLAERPDVAAKDRVLYLMERGAVRQARGQYKESAADFIEAATVIDEMEAYSVSKGAASLVVNDTVQNYRGAPYERTLLHAMTAINHLALADWDSAAVEARRIIESMSPLKRGEFPEDAFSRYMAGFCLEMIDDPSNAALQYGLAGKLAPLVRIDPASGRLSAAVPSPSTNHGTVVWSSRQEATAPPPAARGWRNELICFVLLGRGPSAYDSGASTWNVAAPDHVEIRVNGITVGRSYNLADTMDLVRETEEKQAVMKALKTGARIVIKETAAQAAAAAAHDDVVGDLIRLLLFALEKPDVRRWETLPRWLQVARVPCPADLKEFEIAHRGFSGAIIRAVPVRAPITRRRGTFVAFYREIADSPSPFGSNSNLQTPTPRLQTSSSSGSPAKPKPASAP